MCPIFFCIRSAIKTVCMSLNRVMASVSLIIQLNLFGLRSISREIWKLKMYEFLNVCFTVGYLL